MSYSRHNEDKMKTVTKLNGTINYLEFFKPEIIVHKSFFESEDSTKMKTVRRPKFLSSDWNVRLEAYRDTSERIIRDQWKREREQERSKKLDTKRFLGVNDFDKIWRSKWRLFANPR